LAKNLRSGKERVRGVRKAKGSRSRGFRKAKGSRSRGVGKERIRGFGKAKGSRIRKRKGSRIRGFKGSSGSLGIFSKPKEAMGQGVEWKRQRVRGLEGWRVGKKPERRRNNQINPKNQIEGWKVSKSEGFKESRIRGVKWFSWYLFSKLRS